MTLGEKIKAYMDGHGLTYEEFAARCDLTKGYISMLVRNINPRTGKPPVPKIRTYDRIAKAMNTSMDDLFKEIDDAPVRISDGPEEEIQQSYETDWIAPVPIPNAIPYTPGRAMIPIIGTVRCGPGGLAYEELQGAEMADVANPSEYFWLRASGDSMAPAIEPGDLVLVHMQPQVDNGQLAVVIIAGEEGTLKRFMRTGDTVVLQSFNQLYPPRVFVGDELNDLTIAGRVVETKRKW